MADNVIPALKDVYSATAGAEIAGNMDDLAKAAVNR